MLWLVCFLGLKFDLFLFLFMGKLVRVFLKYCLKVRNLSIDKLMVGWKCKLFL